MTGEKVWPETREEQLYFIMARERGHAIDDHRWWCDPRPNRSQHVALEVLGSDDHPADARLAVPPIAEELLWFKAVMAGLAETLGHEGTERFLDQIERDGFVNPNEKLTSTERTQLKRARESMRKWAVTNS